MKKLWLPAIIVIIWLLVFVAGPWYAGGKVEDRYDALLTQMNSNGAFKFEKASYDKGLFSSETELRISLNMDMFGAAFSQMGKMPETSQVVLKGEVKHGPIMMDDGFSFAVGKIKFLPELSTESQQDVSKVFGTAEPMDLGVQFNWDDSIVSTGSLAGFSSAEEGVSSQPAKLSLDLTDDSKHLVSSFNWGGLTKKATEKDNAAFTFGKVKFSSDSVQVIDELWVGDMDFNIDSISFNDMGKQGEIDNLGFSFKTSMDASKKFVSGAGGYTLQKFSADGQDYAEDFELTMSFDNLHAESLQKLSKAVQEAQQAGGSPEAMQMAMTMQLMAIVPEMVKNGMSVNIDALNAKVMGEQVTSSLKITVAEGTDVAQGMAAIAGVTAIADVSVSRALLDKFPMFANPEMLQGLLQQGMLFEEDGYIKSHAEFKDGQLLVNGTPMPIPGLGM